MSLSPRQQKQLDQIIKHSDVLKVYVCLRTSIRYLDAAPKPSNLDGLSDNNPYMREVEAAWIEAVEFSRKGYDAIAGCPRIYAELLTKFAIKCKHAATIGNSSISIARSELF